MLQTRTPASETPSVLARFRHAREVARAGGVNYWAFSDDADPVSWIEFFEGPDAQHIRATLKALDATPQEPTIFSELELA